MPMPKALGDSIDAQEVPHCIISENDWLHWHSSQEASRFKGQQVVPVGGCSLQRQHAEEASIGSRTA